MKKMHPHVKDRTVTFPHLPQKKKSRTSSSGKEEKEKTLHDNNIVNSDSHASTTNGTFKKPQPLARIKPEANAFNNDVSKYTLTPPPSPQKKSQGSLKRPHPVHLQNIYEVSVSPSKNSSLQMPYRPELSTVNAPATTHKTTYKEKKLEPPPTPQKLRTATAIKRRKLEELPHFELPRTNATDTKLESSDETFLLNPSDDNSAPKKNNDMKGEIYGHQFNNIAIISHPRKNSTLKGQTIRVAVLGHTLILHVNQEGYDKRNGAQIPVGNADIWLDGILVSENAPFNISYCNTLIEASEAFMNAQSISFQFNIDKFVEEMTHTTAMITDTVDTVEQDMSMDEMLSQESKPLPQPESLPLFEETYLIPLTPGTPVTASYRGGNIQLFFAPTSPKKDKQHPLIDPAILTLPSPTLHLTDSGETQHSINDTAAILLQV